MARQQSVRLRQQRWAIVADHLPRAVQRFLEKNESYGDGIDEFGARGEVMQLAKKYRKVKAAVWDGEELTGEPVEEVIEDMIGHCLLLLELLDHEKDSDKYGGTVEFLSDGWGAMYATALKDRFG